jgi:Holliday junction resolvase YEN1
MSPQELKNFFPPWRQGLHAELSTNAGGHLTQRYPTLANSIPHDFPNIDLLLLYAKPLSSWSPGTAKPDLSHLQPSLPDISKLASICERRFGWENNPGGIIERFHNILWDRACIRMLCYKVSCHFLRFCVLPFVIPDTGLIPFVQLTSGFRISVWGIINSSHLSG